MSNLVIGGPNTNKGLEKASGSKYKSKEKKHLIRFMWRNEELRTQKLELLQPKRLWRMLLH